MKVILFCHIKREIFQFVTNILKGDSMMQNVVEFETYEIALTVAHSPSQSYKITMDFYISITYIDNVHRHKQYRAIYH